MLYIVKAMVFLVSCESCTNRILELRIWTMVLGKIVDTRRTNNSILIGKTRLCTNTEQWNLSLKKLLISYNVKSRLIGENPDFLKNWRMLKKWLLKDNVAGYLSLMKQALACKYSNKQLLINSHGKNVHQVMKK